MSVALIAIVVLSFAVVAYSFIGYPMLLSGIVRVRGARPVRRRDIVPHVSFVISAYNEAAVIRAKLTNALRLDYPEELLQIVVVSDASNDGTDEIVAEFAPRVELLRQETRRGKTAGLNRTIPILRGDVVVFSDANAMYEPDALRKLVRSFADADVGCVTGEARYQADGRAVADVGERAYWDYEIQIKRLETQVGSMVGGDGAIYAIRRQLWQTLPEDAINDFLNPLQIVAAGWRAVYEPEAICHEETAGHVRTEYKRRVRIVSRSWRAVFLVPAVLNPFRVGLFAWSLLSHKLLRWLSGAIVGLGLAAMAVFLSRVASGPVLLRGLGGLALLSVGSMALSPRFRRGAAMAGYFAVLNIATLEGVIRGTLGRVSGVWATPREDAAHRMPALAGPQIRVGALLLVVGAAAVASGGGVYYRWGIWEAAEFVFWASLALLGYVYVGYPVFLVMWTQLRPRHVTKASIEPSVCLFVAANDEEDVIEAKLINALALDYPAELLDIVVASDGSVDDTEKLVERFAPRVRLLRLTPRRGKIAAINEGMRAVTAEIVIFSDANTFLEPNAVRALVRNFADPQVGAASGDVALVGERAALGRSEDLYYRYERRVQQAESDAGSMIGADGALYGIRRELFVRPPDDTILDDMAIPMAVVRQGYRVTFERAARAYEYGCETAHEEFSRKSRVVAGAVQFLARTDSSVPLVRPQAAISLFSHKALRWLSPVFATCTLLCSAVLAEGSNVYAAALAAQCVVILIALAGCVPSLRRWSLVAAAHYFWLLQIAAAVGFARGLARRQSVLWQRFARPVSSAPVGAAQ
jgi:cellulose synthase/poly-beta-1,6-N-acetylglucosamine synthase-like glycosyltransferase